MTEPQYDRWNPRRVSSGSFGPVESASLDSGLGAHAMIGLGSLLQALNAAEADDPTGKDDNLTLIPYAFPKTVGKQLQHYGGLAVWYSYDSGDSCTFLVGVIAPVDVGTWELVPAAALPDVHRQRIIERTRPNPSVLQPVD